MNNYDHIYTAADDSNEKNFQLASGYISTTVIAFETAMISAKIEACGIVDFYTADGSLISSVNIPEQTGGTEKYHEVLCRYENGNVTFRFPIVKWIDNYPNCDGEHDRWDTVTIGYHTVNFDVNTSTATLC